MPELNETLEAIEQSLKTFTEQADSRFGTLEKSLETLQAEADERAKAAQRPEADVKAETQDRWIDAKTGETVHVVAKGESLAKHTAHAEHGNISIGKLLKGLATNKWQDADREKAMAEGTGSLGGYLVPNAALGPVIDLARASAAVTNAGARIVDMGSNPQLTMARLSADPTLYQVGEGAEITASDPAYQSVNLSADKYGALVRVSNELLNDSPNAAQEIERVLQEAIANQIDTTALNGDSTLPGILTTDGVLTETGTQDYDLWLDALKALEDANHMPTAGIMSTTIAQTLRKLKVASEANHYAAAPAALASIPMRATSKLAATKAVLGDFTQVLIGVMSAGASVEISRHSRFAFDQTEFRLTWRGDFALAHADAFAVITTQ